MEAGGGDHSRVSRDTPYHAIIAATADQQHCVAHSGVAHSIRPLHPANASGQPLHASVVQPWLPRYSQHTYVPAPCCVLA